MSQFATASHYQQSMDVSAEMLASAMMLVSLAEGAVVHTDYNSSFSRASSSSANSSGTSLSGWGSAATRKSYKVDLCSLGSSSEPMSQPMTQVFADTFDSSWGFYADTQ